MGIAAERLASLIHRHLITIINHHLEGQNINYVNITAVRVTKDQSYATIFFTILEDTSENILLAEQLLLRFKGKIKRDLAVKLKFNRSLPELIFKYDTALAKGNEIESLLDQILEDKHLSRDDVINHKE